MIMERIFYTHTCCKILKCTYKKKYVGNTNICNATKIFIKNTINCMKCTYVLYNHLIYIYTLIV